MIVLAPHFGNWEVLNFWLSSHFPFTAMYEPPKIADLDPVIRHGRERMGAELVPTNPRGVAALLKALKRAEAVGILPDQEPSWGSGVFADFFGRPAYTATLLPKLVARTQARVVTGVACGATTVIVPVYLGELAPPHLRGVLGNAWSRHAVALNSDAPHSSL